MSKTIDELVEIFNREAKLPSIRKADIAGIRAVVTALRDEMRREWFLDDSGLEAVERWMNEILASDGEVKAAGDVYPDGARISGLETTAPAASGSPAAAPDVCEWRNIAMTSEYLAKCGWRQSNIDYRTVCPSCGLPISFKSEAAR